MGAGIMGCCLALELARQQICVDLIDIADTPMTGASLHNEGKLHLGFVYANDPLKKTHSLLLQGSLMFSSIMKRLTECNVAKMAPSHPFHYYIPVNSQLSLEVIEDHFNKVGQVASDLSNNFGHLYLEKNIARFFQRNSSVTHSSLFSADETVASFQTEERSVSTKAVAYIICKAIKEHPSINYHGGTQVYSVARCQGDTNEIELGRDGLIFRKNYPCAINCLWDDKLRIDSTVGVGDDGPWLLRYKATINLHIPSLKNSLIPSATGILGSFGDVVNQGDGSFHISWYPLCKRVQDRNRNGRQLHKMVHKGSLSTFVRIMKRSFPNFATSLASITHRKFVRNNIDEMARYVPSMTSLHKGKRKFQVGGGVILARGSTDIDDPASHLHQRSSIGPVSHGSYISIDTGKYCTAPMFALEAADMVTEVLR